MERSKELLHSELELTGLIGIIEVPASKEELGGDVRMERAMGIADYPIRAGRRRGSRNWLSIPKELVWMVIGYLFGKVAAYRWKRPNLQFLWQAISPLQLLKSVLIAIIWIATGPIVAYALG